MEPEALQAVGGRRAGTENTAAIAALGKACELALASMRQENTEVRRLRDKLEAGILAKVPRAFPTGDVTNRFTLSLYTTEAEIDRVIEVTLEIIAQLR